MKEIPLVKVGEPVRASTVNALIERFNILKPDSPLPLVVVGQAYHWGVFMAPLCERATELSGEMHSVGWPNSVQHFNKLIQTVNSLTETL